jgi:glucose-6-phosphate-specific signal transduction histidine kinase
MNKPKSFGLRGIRERISSLQGEFDIAVVENGGTRLLLKVPSVAGTTDGEAEAGRSVEEPQAKLF